MRVPAMIEEGMRNFCKNPTLVRRNAPTSRKSDIIPRWIMYSKFIIEIILQKETNI